jgi:hypothetical protein
MFGKYQIRIARCILSKVTNMKIYLSPRFPLFLWPYGTIERLPQ